MSSSPTFEDRLEIHELLGRYYQLLDGESSISSASIFTDDGAIVVPTGQFLGLETIDDFFTKRPSDAGRNGRHFISNLVVAASGEGVARADFYLQYVGIVPAPVLKMTGRGECDLVRTTGGWRMRQLRIHIDGSPNPHD